MRLLQVAHNLGRAADLLTRICERAFFTVAGEMKELAVKEPPA
jgi:phosphate uptake regulator